MSSMLATVERQQRVSDREDKRFKHEWSGTNFFLCGVDVCDSLLTIDHCGMAKPDIFDVLSSSLADVVRQSLNTPFREECLQLLEASCSKDLEIKLGPLIKTVVEGKQAVRKVKKQPGNPSDSSQSSSSQTSLTTPDLDSSSGPLNPSVAALPGAKLENPEINLNEDESDQKRLCGDSPKCIDQNESDEEVHLQWD